MTDDVSINTLIDQLLACTEDKGHWAEFFLLCCGQCVPPDRTHFTTGTLVYGCNDDDVDKSSKGFLLIDFVCFVEFLFLFMLTFACQSRLVLPCWTLNNRNAQL